MIASTKGQELHIRLKVLGDAQKAKVMQRFFKTGPGEYGEGDLFLGIRVPEIRKLARQYESLALWETIGLLQSPIHEARLLGLLILVRACLKGDASRQRYLKSEV
jgi:hypothetical protein